MGAAADARPGFWSQAALLIVLTWVYDASHRLRPDAAEVALRHGRAVLRADQALHIAAEQPLNAWVGAHPALGAALSIGYFLAHGLVTAAALVLLWWRRPAAFRLHRNLLFAISLLAFVGYWLFPTAPPRMLPGFVDSVQAALPFATHVEAGAANDYAAMPSVHLAWAVWVVFALWGLARAGWQRALLVLYPAVIALVVLGTANHYMLDLVAGAALTVAAYAGLAVLRRVRA